MFSVFFNQKSTDYPARVLQITGYIPQLVQNAAYTNRFYQHLINNYFIHLLALGCHNTACWNKHSSQIKILDYLTEDFIFICGLKKRNNQLIQFIYNPHMSDTNSNSLQGVFTESFTSKKKPEQSGRSQKIIAFWTEKRSQNQPRGPK